MSKSRAFLLLLAFALPLRGLPPEVTAALEVLQTDAPPGWSFTQTTEAEGKSRVERYRAIGMEPDRWQLLAVDGRPPTPDELEEYAKHQALRAGAGPAPNVKSQIIRDQGEQRSDDGTRSVWRFPLQPANEDDSWAEHMVAEFTVHRPTQVVERVELIAPKPFSPGFAINVTEARTSMLYSTPQDGRPALLQSIQVRIRGKAWIFRSLDSDLSVRYSDYESVRKR